MRSLRVLRVLIVLTVSPAVASPPLPASGADLLGRAAPAWTVTEWHGSEPVSLESLRGRVVVVRFWTDTCPYCARTLPALQALAGAQQKVRFVGLYHSKPRGRERAWTEAVAKARGLGVTFPIAYDRGWKTLDAWWLNGRPGVPTSATFVIDRRGTIVYVHPGPELHPSAEAAHADCAHDFVALEAAIQKALGADQ